VSDSRQGLLMGAGAFTLWGLYPVYFKALGHVSPLEIVAHRILWSTLVLAPLIQVRGAWPAVSGTLLDPRLRWGLAVTTALIATNWFAYVLAVTSGNVLDASLGYFLCPLVNVALGVLVLKERLSPAQIAAVALAGSAVLLLIFKLGIVPRMALFLAISFGLYGLARKRLPVDPTAALFLECALLIPAGLAVAAWLATTGNLRTLDGDPWTLVLLALSGFVTVGPLLLFGMGAKRLPLSTVGILQYIAPSMLFVQGVLVFGEPLNPWRLVAFLLIWCALVIYTADGIMRARGSPEPS
jgi:chloramphenicol-sensitive protein RarD